MVITGHTCLSRVSISSVSVVLPRHSRVWFHALMDLAPWHMLSLARVFVGTCGARLRWLQATCYH